ncbi:hypothetical protein NUW54_g7103 [Trametes sanguinea]|uniref:Uncharacterized protein n=1 Tax=Trametes sanguinea TaxID=158606 RepID=A0ACC1PNQ7_9APHY|nr:hypothetical protein NUW54_g7103 [Trametes sanguinea]
MLVAHYVRGWRGLGGFWVLALFAKVIGKERERGEWHRDAAAIHAELGRSACRTCAAPEVHPSLNLCAADVIDCPPDHLLPTCDFLPSAFLRRVFDALDARLVPLPSIPPSPRYKVTSSDPSYPKLSPGALYNPSPQALTLARPPTPSALPDVPLSLPASSVFVSTSLAPAPPLACVPSPPTIPPSAFRRANTALVLAAKVPSMAAAYVHASCDKHAQRSRIDVTFLSSVLPTALHYRECLLLLLWGCVRKWFSTLPRLSPDPQAAQDRLREPVVLPLPPPSQPLPQLPVRPLLGPDASETVTAVRPRVLPGMLPLLLPASPVAMAPATRSASPRTPTLHRA